MKIKSFKAWCGHCFIYLFLTAGAILMLLPFVWMVSASLKEREEVLMFPVKWIPNPMHFENFAQVFKEIPFALYMANTFKITICILIIQLFTSSFAAYGFAKMDFPAKNILFLGYIATLAIPFQVYMVPQYIVMRRMGFVDSHIGLIIMNAFTPFGVFLIRQFFMGIPDSLCEAARIDGMSEYGIYVKIMLPLTKPALATLALTTFVRAWNDFMRPLIYLNKGNLLTLQVGLRSFISINGADYHLIMAGSLIALVPIFILFIFLQRYFVEGYATAGMKM